MNCTFCKIVANELPSYTLYEDEIVKVFLNINPLVNGHTLIIPKKHYVDISDIPLDVLNHINEITKNMYNLLLDKLPTDGIKIVQNNGYFQEIKHYHIHLIPHFNSWPIKSIEEIYDILKNKR